MQAIIRVAESRGVITAETWGQNGWQAYVPAPLDWSEIGCPQPFDQDKYVNGDLVIYINKPWRDQPMNIGVFDNEFLAEAVLDRLSHVLPAMVSGLHINLSVCLHDGGNLEGLQIADLEAYSRTKCLPDVAFEHFDKRNAKLRSILSEIAGLDGSEHIKVFGSIAKGKQVPGDIDLYVDISGLRSDVERSLTNDLMGIARTNYGLVDPFLDKDGVLRTRNATATGWSRASNSSKIRADGKAGRHIVSAMIAEKPYSTMRAPEPSVGLRL